MDLQKGGGVIYKYIQFCSSPHEFGKFVVYVNIHFIVRKSWLVSTSINVLRHVALTCTETSPSWANYLSHWTKEKFARLFAGIQFILADLISFCHFATSFVISDSLNFTATYAFVSETGIGRKCNSPQKEICFLKANIDLWNGISCVFKSMQ